MSTFAADDFATIAKRQAEIDAQEERGRLEVERRATGWRSGDGHLLVGELPLPPIGNPPAWLQAEIDPTIVKIVSPPDVHSTPRFSWYETVYATQSPAPVEPSGVRSVFDRAFISARSNEFRKEPPTRKP